MIDTNIILDVLLDREGSSELSRAVLWTCEERKAEGFITASSITDLFYIIRHTLIDTEETYQVVGSILDIVKILTVTNTDVLTAFQMHAKDFEDCLMAVCAKSNHCIGIVTRNKKDFLGFGIDLYSPEEFMRLEL